MKVLLDTNFFIDAVRFRINFDDIGILMSEPYVLVTLDSVVNELKRISYSKSKHGRYAKLSLKMIREYGVEILHSDKTADNAILELAKNETIGATNDKELRKRLKSLGRKTIYLKSKKHLAIG